MANMCDDIIDVHNNLREDSGKTCSCLDLYTVL